MPSPIRVDLPQQPYDIKIANHGLQELGRSMTNLKLGKKVLVVSNRTIDRHYGQQAIAALESAGFEVAQVNLSAGERYKTLASVQKIYDAALKNHLERSSTMVALGGGVIGDMTGFAAATCYGASTLCKCQQRYWLWLMLQSVAKQGLITLKEKI